jgi:alpha-ketoglutarate-dependent taurine dioxygenase
MVIARSQTLAVSPLTGTLGAVVEGLDLRQPLDPPVIADIRQALVDHKVLVFRGQDLSPDQLVVFGRSFGELTPAHPIMPSLEGHPEVLEVDATRSREDPRYRDEYENDTWHSDVTFMARPPLGSVLQAKVVPAVGGDTLFSDLQAAYDGLSAPVRRLVDGLRAVHDGRGEFGEFLRTNPEGGFWEGRRFHELEPVEHPVVRVHPESGRRGLFVNPTFTTRIVGVSKAESDAILRLLYDHSVAPEYVVRQRWQAGDVVFWDNRSTMHYPVRDYGAAHRLMHRVTIAGDEPR